MNDVIRVEEGQRYWSEKREKFICGIIMHMRDGSKWLHPYNGDAPFKLCL